MSTSEEKLIERLKEIRDQIRYFGLILGGLFILLELVQYWQHDNMTMGGTIFLFLLRLAVLFGATSYIVKHIKLNYFKTGLTYGQSFSIVFRLFLYASLIVGTFTFVLNRWIDPDYLSVLMENSISTLKGYWESVVATDAQTEYFNDLIEQMEETPSISPLQDMWNKIWSYTTWGIFVAAILSLFLRDKQTTITSVQ